MSGSIKTGKRFSYTVAFKLQVIQYVKEHGNRAGERKYGVSEKLIRDWRGKEAKLQLLPKTLKAQRPGAKPKWPELEERLQEWVEEKRRSGIGLSGTMICLKAKVFAREMNLEDFLGTTSWLSRFMKCKNFVMRQKMRISQRLPA